MENYWDSRSFPTVVLMTTQEEKTKKTENDTEDDMIEVETISLTMDRSLSQNATANAPANAIKSPSALISIVAHATCHDLHPLETGELGNTTEAKIVAEFERALEQVQSQVESSELTAVEAEEAIHFEEMKR